jgi:two-component system cell cycle sensor histidine kinase/response regulator CckA
MASPGEQQCDSNKGLVYFAALRHRAVVASGRGLMELSRDLGIALQGMGRINDRQEYIAADDAYLNLIDHPLDELIGFDWKSSIHPRDIPRAVHAFEDMRLSGIGEFHGHTMTKGGDGFPVRVLLIQNYNEEGGEAGHFCFIRSAHTPIERNVGFRQGYEIFRAALGHSPVGSVLVDPLSGFRRVNEALLTMLGYAGPELSGKNFGDITATEDFDQGANLAYLVLKGVLPGGQFQRQVRRKDGESFSAELSVRIIRDKQGVPVYAIGFIREHPEARQWEGLTNRAKGDTADRRPLAGSYLRKSNSQELLATEQCVRLFNSLSLSVAVSTLPDRRYVAASDGFLRLFGCRREELIGRTGQELKIFAETRVATGIRELNASPRHVQEVEVTRLSQSGDQGTRCLRAETIELDGVDYLLEVFRDIGVQKETEELLRLSEERYQAIAEQGWEGIVLVDPVNKKILEATAPFLRLLGYTRQEVASLSLYDLTAKNPAIVDNDIGNAVASKSRLIGEWPFRRKDGGMVDLEVSTNTAYYGGGLVVRLVGCDISERRVLEEQLRHAAKMEALGRFAGGIAHDFNNLLVGILGYSTLLEGKLHENPKLSKLSHEITSVALRARELTSKLLSISRRQVLPAELLDINAVVKSEESLLQRILGEDIEFHSELNPVTARVRANPGQIEQVIMNLAANSRDAMPHGGKLIIKTDEILVDEALALRKPGLISGKYVRLTIKDTGLGMDSVTLSHLFEPFYTTKDAGVGTGLGLSTVYGIVKQIGGFIEVGSQVNVGTTFDIYLPRVEEQHSLFHPGETKSHHAPVSTTVLVVEDDTTVRSLVVDILEAEGYEVLSAEEAEQAMILAKSYDGPIHLVVTDIVMPNRSGCALAAELLRLRPDTRILFISGYSDREIVRLTQAGTPANFIPKPFTPEELQRKVHEVLEDSSIN